MEAAPIHPADLLFMKGEYPAGRKYPVPGGLEGSGTVIAAGDDSSKNLIGKRVGFFPAGNNGSWAEYSIANSNLIYENNTNIEIIFNSSRNNATSLPT